MDTILARCIRESLPLRLKEGNLYLIDRNAHPSSIFFAEFVNVYDVQSKDYICEAMPDRFITEDRPW